MNETCPGRETLLLHTEGELSGREADDVSEHVARCPDCEEAVSRLRVLTAALRRAGEPEGRSRAADPDAPLGSLFSGECPGAEAIAGYADGSLETGAAAEVEKHLVSCGACLSEVADLWSMSGPAEHDAPDSAVAAVLARLGNESRTAVLRWAERSIELVRDFASGLADDVSRGLVLGPAPAAAVSRSSGQEVRLHWSGGGGAVLEGIARAERGGVSLTGRVTVGGAPGASTSAALSSAAVRKGPESLDADGRFGPWPLSYGTNLLRLTGLPPEARGAEELVIQVDVAEDGEE
ncbi:MAG: zf-HC2 domain-containing protein [Candidatus Eisenbacteria bacterium]